MFKRISTTVLSAGLVWGCNSLDSSGTDEHSKRIIPTDKRVVQQALTTPPPISGGTLAVDPTGAFAVAADPDRDRLSIVDLRNQSVQTLELEQGDEPGRVAMDDDGRAFVALRGAGELLTVDVGNASIMDRRAACGAPRGVAYDAEKDAVHVACTDGKLVTLPAAGGRAMRTLPIDEDVRDVIVQPGGLLVSRFKSAELLSVTEDGQVSSRVQPPVMTQEVFQPDQFGGLNSETRNSLPHVAWRTALSTSGEVVMLHQDSREGEINIDEDESEQVVQSSPYGGSAADGREGFSCEGVVQTAVSVASPGQQVRTANVAGSVLSVDLAVSPFADRVAIAQAGTPDPEAPRPFTLRDDNDGDSVPFSDLGPATAGVSPAQAQVLLVNMDNVRQGFSPNCTIPETVTVDGQATAVAFAPNGDLLIQTREPARLFVMESAPFGEPQMIALGGDSVLDTGHELFHRNSGGGIACASCHAEGGDDGHTWEFSNIGPRRTQAVHVGLEGTEPFHWDGDMSDLGMIMDEVFVGRMGGVHQNSGRLSALASWVFQLQPPAAMVESEDAAAVRGKALFESEDVGCASCHNGAKFTNNESFDVGTTDDGRALQVPSLRGIAYRAPFIHTGCAQTLEDRFLDPACGGGDKHGHTSQLSDNQVEDLVAYLKTL